MAGEKRERYELDYAVYRLSLKEWFFYGMVGLCLAALAAFVFYKSALAFVLFCPLSILYPIWKRDDLKKRRLEKLSLHIKDGLMAVAASLSAGYSVENAFREGEKELEFLYGKTDLAKKELSILLYKIERNQPVEQAWDQLALRCQLDDIRNFAQVFHIAKRTGGDLVAIIRQTVDRMEEKAHVKEEIQTITTSVRYEGKIMMIAPLFLLAYLSLASPSFLTPMYHTLAGRIAMTICLILYIAAYRISKKIMEIEV